MSVDTEGPNQALSIKAELRAKIEAGNLAVGERVASELELARVYGVGRRVARQVLQDLQKEGFLERGRGRRGSYVSGGAGKQGKGFVGIVVGHPYAYPHAQVIPNLVAAIEKHLSGQGVGVRVYGTDGSHEQTEKMIAKAVLEAADGLLIFPPEESIASREVTSLVHRGYPIAAFGRAYLGTITDCAMVNNEEGAYLAVEHLLALGHSRIGFVSSVSVRNQSIAGRLNGYKAALETAGVDNVATDEALIVTGSAWVTDSYRLVTEERATAVFACNDIIAMELMREFTAMGIRVPCDVSIVGFDNMHIGSIYMVPLTTIEQPLAEIGKTAAQMVLDRIANRSENPRWEFLKPSLIVRQSTGVRNRDV